MVKKIGLDIGNFAIKMVELHTSRASRKLAGLGYKKIESHSTESLIEAVKSIYSESRMGATSVNVSISGPQVITRFVTMPNMSPQEIKSALTFELEKNMPFNPKEMIYDYQVLGQDSPKRMEILLTAVKKGYVEQYISIAESCGLALEAIDVDCFALANAFSYNLREVLTANKTVALLNIGDRYTNLDILKRDVLSFSRDIQIGGRDFNEAIARVCGVDIAAAERIKIHPEERTVDIGMAVRMVLANLIDEIRLSFGYFENKFGKNIDHVYLSGGSCGLAGLKEFIDENLGVKSALWDPLGSIVIDTAGTGGSIQSDIRLSLAVSIGLALR